MRLATRVVVHAGLLALAFYAGHGWEDWGRYLFRGPPRVMVTTAEIPIGGPPKGWQAGIKSSRPCDRPTLGGIMPGTPVEVRHVGPIHYIKAEFRVLGQPPLFEVTAHQGSALQRQMLCQVD
jgi:hypothetical protein